MKISKITPSGSDFMSFLKSDKLVIEGGGGGGGSQIQHFLRYLLHKIRSDIEISLKPTGIKLSADPIKIYHTVYVCGKKTCGTIAE